MLTTFLLTPDERYIITADRDEHIRVSWFPQGYAVERYCLGHEKCVLCCRSVMIDPDLIMRSGSCPPSTYHPFNKMYSYLVVAIPY